MKHYVPVYSVCCILHRVIRIPKTIMHRGLFTLYIILQVAYNALVSIYATKPSTCINYVQRQNKLSRIVSEFIAYFITDEAYTII